VDQSTATRFAGSTKVEREECFYEWASAYAKEAVSSPHRPFVIAKSQSSRSSGSHIWNDSAEPHRDDPSDSETDITDESPSVSPRTRDGESSSVSVPLRSDRYDRTYSKRPFLVVEEGGARTRKPRAPKTEAGNTGTAAVQNLVNDDRGEERAVATVSSPQKSEVKRPPLFIQRLIQESRESRDTEAEDQSAKISSRSTLHRARSVVSSPCYQQFQVWAQAAAHTMSNMTEPAVCTTHMTTLGKTTTTTTTTTATATATTTTGSRPVSASSCATSTAPSRRPASAGSRVGGSSKSRDYCQPWSVSLSTFFNVNTGLPVPSVKTFGRTSRTFFGALRTGSQENPVPVFSAHKRRVVPGTIVLVYDFYAKLQAPAIQLCGKARSYDEAKRADETLSQGELTSLLKDFNVVPKLLSREELAHIWGSHSREEGHVKFTELTIVEAVECFTRIALVVFSKQMARPLLEELTRLVADHEHGRASASARLGSHHTTCRVCFVSSHMG
jgi:hypothetical protein